MKLKKIMLTLGLAAASSTLLAQTKVSQLDADTLLVELRYGKPPHQRMLIERADKPAAFAAFDELRLQPKRKLFAGFGAPGKGNYPRPVRGVEPVQERSEFAQFEESREAPDRRAHWHGAPGKGRPLN